MTLRRRQQEAAKALEEAPDGNGPESPASDDEPLTLTCLTCGHLEEVEDLHAAFSCSECQAVNTSHLSIEELQAFEDGNREA